MIIDDAYHYLRIHGIVGHHRTTVTVPLNLDADLRTRDNAITNQGFDNGPVTTQKNYVNFKTNGSTNGITNDCLTNHTARNIRAPHSAGHVGHKLLVWSAADSGALERSLKSYARYYHDKILGDAKQLEQLAYTLTARRTHMQWRTFAIMNPGQHGRAQDGVPYEEASDTLPTINPTKASTEKNKVIFIFTGQGAQYCGMGIGLLVYPVFRDSLARSNDMLAEMGCNWSIIGEDTPVPQWFSTKYSKVLTTINR